MMKIKTEPQAENDGSNHVESIEGWKLAPDLLMVGGKPSRLEERILAFHDNEAVVDREFLNQLFNDLSLRFGSLAFSLPGFLRLPWAERHKRLHLASPLYVALIICRYLTAEDPASQVGILLRDHHNRALSPRRVDAKSLFNAICKGLAIAVDSPISKAVFNHLQQTLILWRSHILDPSIEESLILQPGQERLNGFLLDLRTLADLAMALHLKQALFNNPQHQPLPPLNQTNIKEWVTLRSRQMSHGLFCLHQERWDCGVEMMAAKAPHLATLLLIKMHLAQSYNEQLVVLGLQSNLVTDQVSIDQFDGNSCLKRYPSNNR